eukprot:1157910-Pelagomonas_calceolata.AAC.9
MEGSCPNLALSVIFLYELSTRDAINGPGVTQSNSGFHHDDLGPWHVVKKHTSFVSSYPWLRCGEPCQSKLTIYYPGRGLTHVMLSGHSGEFPLLLDILGLFNT